MWLQKGQVEKKTGGNGLVAVAIDKDKGSQHALKWAIENLLSRGQTVVLIHVVRRSSCHSSGSQGHSQVSDVNSACPSKHQIEKLTKDLFLTFHCFCTRKDVQCHDIVLEDSDVVRALSEYASYAAIENLILGATSHHGFLRRFKTSDTPSSVSKAAPDFCTVYVVSKGKISSVRKASRSAPHASPLHEKINSNKEASDKITAAGERTRLSIREKASYKPRIVRDRTESIKSPFSAGKYVNSPMRGDFDEVSDRSYISSGRPSIDCMSSSHYESIDLGRTSRLSVSSEQSLGSIRGGIRITDMNPSHEFSSVSHDSGVTSSSENMDEMEAEMRRLKLELKQTMDLYSTACKEALTAKQKATELSRWRMEEERRMEEARVAEEASRAIAEQERTKCRAAIEAAVVSQRIAERESEKRINTEMKALQESEDMRRTMNAFNRQDARYRKYTIEEIEEATNFFDPSRKIGEGGYGPVYKCSLDHTPVAVKILRPDAAQGQSQFQQEIEVLSCIRHPNMVLLLGACPEYGCLVYEYMAKGSLDDCLFVREKRPVLSWQIRFRIAAEIATGLLFLHQTKPEPLVHRDLKPGNILLDNNYVSKIGDVGLARLVPPSLADTVTQYRMTSTAGTFCYIDPEYQQTGMLGVKSDVYSLGIMLLQIITAKAPMGLTQHVKKAIENGTFAEMLDPAVPDWPVDEALSFAKLALQCAELRRKDRPDLGQVILPVLNKLRELAEDNMQQPIMYSASRGPSPNHSYASIAPDVISDALPGRSGYSSKSRSSTSSPMKL